jgi:uncharacterized protein (DUF2236 family)
MAHQPGVPDTLPLGRDSITYRLTCEPVNLLVGGPRALVLQVMHPAVGAGVAQHSDYESNPYNRLFRTLQTMTQLSLGTAERSQEMARLLRRSHATINGIREDGAPYRALDTENMRWVWATLLDTVIAVAETFVRPLDPDEATRLYAEWLLIAEGCGVARDDCPPDIDAFRTYVDEVVRGDLTATTTARNVHAMLQTPPLPFPLRQAASAVFGILLPGQLPAGLRAALDVEWTDTDQRVFDTVAAGSRLVCRLTPGPVRRLPGALFTYANLRAPKPRPRQRLDAAA